MTLTVSNVAERYDISAQTVRTWCDTFNEWLSPSATPPAGEVRTFTSDDLAVLSLVASMRDKRIGYEDIKIALASGERATAVDSVRTENGATNEAEGEQSRSLALAMRYEAQVAFRDGQIAQLEQSEAQLRQALTEAQRQAARAETLLEQYEKDREEKSSRVEEVPTRAAPSIEEHPKWWQWWKR